MITKPEHVKLKILLEQIQEQVAPSSIGPEVIDRHLYLELKVWIAKLARETQGHTIYD